MFQERCELPTLIFVMLFILNTPVHFPLDTRDAFPSIPFPLDGLARELVFLPQLHFQCDAGAVVDDANT